MGKYLFSVVVPVYNAERYLRETLHSIDCLQGSFSVLFVDDGSSDASAQILREYCKTRDNARLIEKPHGGVSAARNCGLAAADGEYVLFLDADDAYEGAVFEVLEGKIRQNEADIVVFGAKVKNYSKDFTLEDIEPRDYTYYRFEPDILFREKGSKPFIWNCAYKRDFLCRNGIRFEETLALGEDLAFQFWAFPCAETVRFIPDKLYCYHYLRYASAMCDFLKEHRLRMEKHLALISVLIARVYSLENLQKCSREFWLWLLDFFYDDYRRLDAKDLKDISAGFSEVLKKNAIKISKLPIPLRKKLCYFGMAKPFLVRMRLLKRKILHMKIKEH